MNAAYSPTNPMARVMALRNFRLLFTGAGVADDRLDGISPRPERLQPESHSRAGGKKRGLKLMLRRNEGERNATY
jgi:hypothetical protein